MQVKLLRVLQERAFEPVGSRREVSEGETVASTTMGTLYDLLGALPSDDAEGLRTAFRKAAKATHPDITKATTGNIAEIFI